MMADNQGVKRNRNSERRHNLGYMQASTWEASTDGRM